MRVRLRVRLSVGTHPLMIACIVGKATCMHPNGEGGGVSMHVWHWGRMQCNGHMGMAASCKSTLIHAAYLKQRIHAEECVITMSSPRLQHADNLCCA